jgi:hypothetical protein
MSYDEIPLHPCPGQWCTVCTPPEPVRILLGGPLRGRGFELIDDPNPNLVSVVTRFGRPKRQSKGRFFFKMGGRTQAWRVPDLRAIGEQEANT